MELLKMLATAKGPSGTEHAVKDIILNEVKKTADEINIDTLGNLIARKKGKGKKLMLSAHMDEVGIIATVIDENNFVSFSAIGNVKVNALHCSKVIFPNDIVGIIAEKSEKPTKSSDLFIDIIGSCKGESLNSISVGDAAVFASDFIISGDFISSKALDNRIGCYILIQTLKQISKLKTDSDIYFAFTVQEELGLRGAKAASMSIMPDYAISVDATPCDANGKGALKLGNGPAVKIMDGAIICHPFIKSLLKDSAEKEGISIQFEVSEKVSTDAGAIHTAGVGVAAGALSIPVRYLHTACEKASITDIINAVKILTKVCTEVL